MDPLVIALIASGIVAIGAGAILWLLDRRAPPDVQQPQPGDHKDPMLTVDPGVFPDPKPDEQVPPPTPEPTPPTAGVPASPTPLAPADVSTCFLEPPPVDVPSFSVVALGLRGAGKTILLAVMFHELALRGDRRGFFLTTDFTADRRLTEIYTQVCDTKAPWPSGTGLGDTYLFKFDCRTGVKAGGKRPVLRIEYLDYAGETLQRHGKDPEELMLEQRVGEAHAVLVVIDGARVAQLLRGEQIGLDYFDIWIRPLLGLAARAKCPVQLVVTKWDLVLPCASPDDALEVLLQCVVNRLKEFDAIAHLIEAHEESRDPVRVIPVSAVGGGFASLQNNGRVVKLAYGTVAPVNVEIPLSAVLPDGVKGVERWPDPAYVAALDDEIRRRTLTAEPLTASSLLDSPAGRVLRDCIGGMADDRFVELFVELRVRRMSWTTPPAGDDPVVATQSLRAQIVEDMQRVLAEFDERWPGSESGMT